MQEEFLQNPGLTIPGEGTLQGIVAGKVPAIDQSGQSPLKTSTAGPTM